MAEREESNIELKCGEMEKVGQAKRSLKCNVEQCTGMCSMGSLSTV